MTDKIEQDIYEVEIGAMVTINVTTSFPIAAANKEEALEKAKALFDSYLEDNYGYADYDDCQIGYVGKIKYSK